MKNLIGRKPTTGIFVVLMMALLPVRGYPINQFTHRIVEIFTSLKAGQVEKCSELMERAKAVGYNAAIVGDMSLQALTISDFEAQVKALKAKADALGMPLMPMGFIQGLPTRVDVNHAEVHKVVGTPFTVSGTSASVLQETPIVVPNGGFEEFKGDAPMNWRFSGGCAPTVSVFKDAAVKRTGESSVRIEAPKGQSYMTTHTQLLPGRAYRISLWIKTEGYTGAKDFAVSIRDQSGKGHLMDRSYGYPLTTAENLWQRPQNTQTWVQYRIGFTTFKGAGKVSVELKVASRFNPQWEGKCWVDDIEIEEVGLWLMARRPTLPIVVTSEDGSTTYEETKDFVVEKERLAIPAGSAVRDGQKLKVNWYRLADEDGKWPPSSFCHQGAWDVVKDNAALLTSCFGKPSGWFLKYSEWRVSFWDPVCVQIHGTGGAGNYLGQVAGRTTDILREVTGNCNIETHIWNDSYDPYHNAGNVTSGYRYSNGPIYGSWNWLDKKSIIHNWNVHRKVKSLLFYAGKDPDHSIRNPLRQILCFHEGTMGWLDSLAAAEAQGLPDGTVVGAAFGSWSNDFANLEAAANESKSAGRWGSNPYPLEPIDAGACESEIAHSGTTPQAGFSLSSATDGKRIWFVLPEAGHVRLSVRDAKGREVTELASGVFGSGKRTIRWDSSELASGIYVISLNTPRGHLVRRLALM